MNKKVHKIIKKYRKKLKMTQEDLAKKLGVSSSMVSYWETKKGVPDKELIPKIAEALKISKRKFEELKYRNDMGKFKTNIEKIFNFSSLFIIVFIIFSTASTLILNYKGIENELYFSTTDNICYNLITVDKKNVEKANENLKKIETSDKLIYSDEDRELIINLLKIYKSNSEEIVKNGVKKWCGSPKNNYEAVIGMEKVYKMVENEINDDYDTTILGRIIYKYNEVIDKKNEIRRVDVTKFKELLKHRASLELYMYRYYNQYKYLQYRYPNYGSMYQLSTVSHINSFDYSEYYLEMTEYVMKVGGIDE